MHCPLVLFLLFGHLASPAVLSTRQTLAGLPACGSTCLSSAQGCTVSATSCQCTSGLNSVSTCLQNSCPSTTEAATANSLISQLCHSVNSTSVTGNAGLASTLSTSISSSTTSAKSSKSTSSKSKAAKAKAAAAQTARTWTIIGIIFGVLIVTFFAAACYRKHRRNVAAAATASRGQITNHSEELRVINSRSTFGPSSTIKEPSS